VRIISIALLISVVSVAPISSTSHAQSRQSGEYWYSTYCGSCHGKAGKGDGPVSKSLSKAPADLTRLSEANGGAFPFGRVADVIDGRQEVGAHGTREMPVWGRALRFGPTIVRDRVRAIVAYLSTLQGK